MDILQPGAEVKAFLDGTILATTSRDKREDEWGDLGRGSSVDPMVGPKLASATRAKVPCRRGPEDGAHVWVVGYVQMAPRAGGIRPLEP